MPAAVKIVEVGPRDGLQNEKTAISLELKKRFVRNLIKAGLRSIELTSFVSPKWIPQLADADQLCAGLDLGSAQFSALVPNQRGLERAIAAGIGPISLFTAASDTFCRRNINMSCEESVAVFAHLIEQVQDQNRFIRAYISTAFECPYEGRIDPGSVARLAERLFEIGVQQISFADTIGTAAPTEVDALLKALIPNFEVSRIALHFHDTNGTAIANVCKGLEHGILTFDSSSGGLGGCPYAPGAGGNLATEDLVYLLEREGFETGVDLEVLATSSLEVLENLGRVPSAKAQLAALSRASGDSCAM